MPSKKDKIEATIYNPYSTAQGLPTFDVSENGYLSIGFGAVKPGKKGELAIYGHTSCRDGLCYTFRDGIVGVSNTSITWDEGFLPTDKMHLGVTFGMRHKSGQTASTEEQELVGDWATRSERLLHIFEDFAGWPRTRMYSLKLKNKNAEGRKKGYYFLGSRRWVKAPPMVSFYALIIRMCKDEIWAKPKDFNAVEKLAFDRAGEFKKDDGWIQRTSEYWRRVLKEYPNLFRKRKITHYWGSLEGSDGLAALVEGEACIKLPKK